MKVGWEAGGVTVRESLADEDEVTFDKVSCFINSKVINAGEEGEFLCLCYSFFVVCVCVKMCLFS